MTTQNQVIKEEKTASEFKQEQVLPTLKPLVKKDKLLKMNPRHVWEDVTQKYWYFDTWFSKGILIAMAVLSVYAIARMIAQGIW